MVAVAPVSICSQCIHHQRRQMERSVRRRYSTIDASTVQRPTNFPASCPWPSMPATWNGGERRRLGDGWMDICGPYGRHHQCLFNTSPLAMSPIAPTGTRHRTIADHPGTTRKSEAGSSAAASKQLRAGADRREARSQLEPRERTHVASPCARRSEGRTGRQRETNATRADASKCGE